MVRHIAAQPKSPQDAVTVQYVSRQEGAALLDRQARKYLGMSGDEFARRYRAGKIEEPERSTVRRVSLLIPLAED